MLSATCDEFLKNLCDCIELAEGNFGELPIMKISPSTTSVTSVKKSLENHFYTGTLLFLITD